MKRKSPLIYRKDGSLDFGPLTLAITSAFGLCMFMLDASGIIRVSIAAWSYLGAFTTMAFIAGATAERAYWIAISRAPAEVGQAIASSQMPAVAESNPALPDLWTDDESGDMP